MAQKWEAEPGLVDPKSWYEGYDNGVKDTLEAQAKEIAELKAALAASREQCAKVADEWMRDYAADACCDGAQAEAAFEIAAAIRGMS